MPSKQATVHMDEEGRVTIPKEVRQALDIDGERHIIDLEVSIDDD